MIAFLLSLAIVVTPHPKAVPVPPLSAIWQPRTHQKVFVTIGVPTRYHGYWLYTVVKEDPNQKWDQVPIYDDRELYILTDDDR